MKNELIDGIILINMKNTFHLNKIIIFDYFKDLPEKKTIIFFSIFFQLSTFLEHEILHIINNKDIERIAYK